MEMQSIPQSQRLSLSCPSWFVPKLAKLRRASYTHRNPKRKESDVMATPYCYFQKRIVPLEEAKVGVMTHAFLYGTAVFEGVRGNWSEERGQSLIFRPIEHFRRLKQSARIMHIDLPQSADELADISAQV